MLSAERTAESDLTSGANPANKIKRLAGATCQDRPQSSPVRGTQTSLTRDAKDQGPSPAETMFGLIAGLGGLAWIIGLLIYTA